MRNEFFEVIEVSAPCNNCVIIKIKSFGGDVFSYPEQYLLGIQQLEKESKNKSYRKLFGQTAGDIIMGLELRVDRLEVRNDYALRRIDEL